MVARKKMKDGGQQWNGIYRNGSWDCELAGLVRNYEQWWNSALLVQNVQTQTIFAHNFL